MKVKTNEHGNIELEAEDGMALCRKGEPSPTTLTSISLGISDSADNWEDCEYGEPGESGEPTRYSVRSIIRELKACGKYDAVRSLLETAKYDWEFVGSNYLASNDEDFKRMLAAVVEQGIMTRQEMDDMLPKCIWSAE